MGFHWNLHFVVEGLYEKNRACNLLILCSLNNEPQPGYLETRTGRESGSSAGRTGAATTEKHRLSCLWVNIILSTNLLFFHWIFINTASQKARKICLNFILSAVLTKKSKEEGLMCSWSFSWQRSGTVRVNWKLSASPRGMEIVWECRGEAEDLVPGQGHVPGWGAGWAARALLGSGGGRREKIRVDREGSLLLELFGGQRRSFVCFIWVAEVCGGLHLSWIENNILNNLFITFYLHLLDSIRDAQ